MTCMDVRENLSAYLDGELDREQAAAVASHLAGCEGCRAELESLRRVTETLHALPRRAAPAEIEREVVAQLERDALLAPEAAPLPSTRRRSLALPIFGGAALAAAVLVAVGVYIHWNSQNIREVGPVVAMTDDSAKYGSARYDEKSAHGAPGGANELEKNLDDSNRLESRDDAAAGRVSGKAGDTVAMKPSEKRVFTKGGGAELPAIEQPAAPVATPPAETKVAEGWRGEETPAAPDGLGAIAEAEAPPARPEVLELKLTSADFAVERARITTLAASLDIRTVQAARLDIDADGYAMRKQAEPPKDKPVGEAGAKLGKLDGKDAGRVNDALDKVAQNSRTDDDYEATVARLLEVIERSEAKDAASPVIVLAVPEEKLGPFVAKLAAYQEEGEGVKVKSIAPSPARQKSAVKKESQVAKQNADALDEFMTALDDAAAEDAERERMAQDTAGRAGEGGLTGGKTRLSDTRHVQHPTDAEGKDLAKAPDRTAQLKPAPAAPTKYVYLQILLTKPAAGK